MRLSTRLSAFFLGALAIVLAGFSATLYASARSYLHRQVDERIDGALAVLAAAAEIHPDAVEWEPDERDLPLGRDAGPDRLRWAVSDDSGHRVDRSRNLDVTEMPAGWESRPSQVTDRLGRTWRIGRRRLLPSAAPAPGRPAGRLRPRWSTSLDLTVAAPVGPTERTLAALGWSLAGLSLVVWLIAAALGRGLVRRALSPLGRMVDSARTLDAADPGWSLPEAGTGDESSTKLGRAFNDLLARLRVAFERQRRVSGDASHPLRTPLTALVGQIDVALRRERSPEEYRRVLGLVRGQAGNLARIVEALLFLGRADAEAGLPDTETLDLTAWVAGHIADHPSGAEIRLDLPEGGRPLKVRAHAALLGQLVDNLLGNAAKYGDLGAPVVVRLVDDGAVAALSVEDRGPGIDPADLPRIFEPFFRAERARRLGRPGVGLGLAVAKRIAAAAGAGRSTSRARRGGAAGSPSPCRSRSRRRLFLMSSNRIDRCSRTSCPPPRPGLGRSISIVDDGCPPNDSYPQGKAPPDASRTDPRRRIARDRRGGPVRLLADEGQGGRRQARRAGEGREDARRGRPEPTITLTPEAETRLRLKTVPVEAKDVARTRSVGGEVVVPPGRTILVSSPIAGTLYAPKTGLPSPGMPVKKGQIIFNLVPLLSSEGPRDVRHDPGRGAGPGRAGREAARAGEGRPRPGRADAPAEPRRIGGRRGRAVGIRGRRGGSRAATTPAARRSSRRSRGPRGTLEPVPIAAEGAASSATCSSRRGRRSPRGPPSSTSSTSTRSTSGSRSMSATSPRSTTRAPPRSATSPTPPAPPSGPPAASPTRPRATRARGHGRPLLRGRRTRTVPSAPASGSA